jgi:hypothetical protein
VGQTRIQGEYEFHRQEMVAAFNFLPGEKFEFFYSYGAMDRNATGTFYISGDTLHLKSDKEAGKDFTIKSQSKEGIGYRIQFENENKFLLSNIRCSFFTGDKRLDLFTNEEGLIETDISHCDKIFVFHQLYPDMVTLIKDEKNNNNQFTLTLKPSLVQVSFQGVEYKVEGNKLIATMPNYVFMMETNVEFIKIK